MQYIEAISNEEAKFKTVFLAGGISNCPDWQKQVTEALSDLDITIYNPRRKNFDIENPQETEKQITWEYERLRKADFIIFHFSSATLNPITLFEYGGALERNKPLFVNIHPEYKRKTDIEIQTKLHRPEIQITYTIEALTKQIRNYFEGNFN